MTKVRGDGANGADDRSAGPARYEDFAHQADAGIRGLGSSMAEAFSQAAMALTAIVTDPAGVRALAPVDVHCDAPDDVTLFVDWINALIFEMSVRKMLFSRFEVKIERRRLSAIAWGEPVDRVRHEPAAEPKGATFTQALVRCDAAGHWIAQCVVDV